jgi:outer membrane beta-barrel protein
MKSVNWILLSLVLFPSLSFAQPFTHKFEVSAFLGTSLNDRDHSEHLFVPDIGLPGNPSTVITKTEFDGGLLFNLKAGYYLNENFQLEGAYTIGPSQKLKVDSEFECNSDGECAGPFHNELDASSYYVDGNVLYNFHYGKFTPFISGGIGLAKTTLHIEHSNDLAFNFGVGTKVYFGKVGFRVELNNHIIRNYQFTESEQNDIQLNSGVMLRF